MNASLIIAIVVQAAQFIVGLTGLAGTPLGAIADELPALIARLYGLIDAAKAALSEDDVAVLDARLAEVLPQIVAARDALSAAVAAAQANAS